MQHNFYPRLKIIVCVVVYDSTDEIQRWFQAWPFLSKDKLIVYHNYDGEGPSPGQRAIIEKGPCIYRPRKNQGLDIGAFRDAIRESGDWDVMLWATDDCLPMRKNLLERIEEIFAKPDVGLVGHQWAEPTHVRTVGFAIRRIVADELVFSEIKDKDDCFLFEFGPKSLTKQVWAMGYGIKLLKGNRCYPGYIMGDDGGWMWDCHWNNWQNSFANFKREFSGISISLGC